MAGRALLVCALCALCCAAGGGWAWDHLCDEDGRRLLNKTAKEVSPYCASLGAPKEGTKKTTLQNEQSSPPQMENGVVVGGQGEAAGRTDGALLPSPGPGGGGGATGPEEKGPQAPTAGSSGHSAAVPATPGASEAQGDHLTSVDVSEGTSAGADGELKKVAGTADLSQQQREGETQSGPGATQTTPGAAASLTDSKNDLSQSQAQEYRGEQGASTQLSGREAATLPDVTSNAADGEGRETTQLSPPASREGAGGQGGKPTEQETKDATDSDAAWNPDGQREVAAASAAAGTANEPTPAVESTATDARNNATTTGGDSGSSPAAQPQPESSVAATEAGQPEQKEQSAVPASQEETETSGERGEATQPAAGTAAQAVATTNVTSAAKAAPGDSDGSSTAASHSASLLALFLLLACAAAAAMLAA
ncbi:mucin-associated surface protein (MASP) [Trypanosoma conorhini]|uniref:Mucin-associated surface protein (MASP) n=1 Tax=Trypanosoma conorhini TaxID=83891 RepID=A0A3R7M2T3_9TRYP|nr:mucin-associated surface protein (MASP) [Trypanosoma conorhini]RNE95108.1 mucin-associated surface protein (MASP) [Trypanosoma conorhini]